MQPPTRNTFPWIIFLVLAAGVGLGYVLPRPGTRLRQAPPIDVIELGRQLQATEQVGRYQFFVVGESRVPMRGDTATGEVTIAMPANQETAAAYLGPRH